MRNRWAFLLQGVWLERPDVNREVRRFSRQFGTGSRYCTLHEKYDHKDMNVKTFTG
ncbi:MAG TPA: hypothetical protein PKG63_02965 [Bacteroidales bacterium]|nr:hypothetical protein [Bacteroidales bacterium]